MAERLVADAALEIALDLAKSPGWVEQHGLKIRGENLDMDQGALELDVAKDPRGHLPEFVRPQSDAGWWDRVGEYEQLISAEVDRARRTGSELDLAIVVVRDEATRDEVKKVKKALSNLRLEFLDQIDRNNRRRTLTVGTVRLSTVHSIRGVDAADPVVGHRGDGSHSGGCPQRDHERRTLDHVAA